MSGKVRFVALALIAGVGFLQACGGGDGASEEEGGTVLLDGSSTVFPVSAAIAEEYQILNPSVEVPVGFSGTGGGFSRFCAGETDITNASREIRDGEIENCAANGIEYTEIPVAWDGLSVVIHPENDFATCLTVDELRRIWEPGSEVSLWSEVRDGFPAEEILLFGAGTQSGTFDYFTEAIVGESGASRPDYQASEDDNILVQGVGGNVHSLGYFGYAYVVENEGRLTTAAVDNGAGCVHPTQQTIEDGSYAPLSRPLYIYVRHDSMERPEVRDFVEFYLTEAGAIVPSTGYVPLSAEDYQTHLSAIMAVVGMAP